MTAGRAPTSRRRHGASLGQIPLSSGEIELYSRQDEAARRRRRLLAVREQERRLAQQVTKRYRANLQQLQSHKAKKTQMQLSEEQHKMLTELHRRYQSSLQSMGTAQRNAREKLLELMEQAQLEQLKWTYNRQVTGEQRVEEAQEAQEEEEAQKLARRRLMEQNLQRLKELSDKQRAHASARAREEQEMALQRIKEREELDKLRRMNSPQEVFVTPRPHAEDVRSYRFTRTHCFVPPVSVVDPKEERPTVTVIKHNRNHPAAMHGVEEASKYREEMDQKRERDRLTTEERGETAAERGKAALHNVTSREKGQQALEWLALVDKLERRERGVNVAGGDDDLLAVVDAEGRPEDPERIAERVFAELLGLGDESLDLSAFSIETDEDDQSVGTPEADHVGADNPAKSNAGNREKNKPNLLGSVAEKKPGHSKPITAGERTKATRDNAGQPMKAKAGGDTQKRSKTNMRGDKDVSPDYIEVPFRLDHDEESVEQHDNVRKAKGDCLDSDADNVHQGGEQLERMKKGYHTKSAPLDDKRMPDWRNERRHSNTSTEERPEGIDSEDEAISQLSQGNESIPQQETRAQDDLDHLFPMLPQGRPLNRAQRLHGPARSWSSDSNVGEGGLKVDKTAVGSTGRWPRYLTSRESFIDSDEPQDASALPVTSDESDAISPRSSTSGEIFTSGGYQSASSVKGRYEKGNTDFIAGVRESGVSGAFSTDKDNRGEESILRGAPANLSGAQTPAQTDIHRRDDDTSSATSFIKGSSFDDISPPESPVEPVRLSIHAQHNDGVNYHDELGRQEVDARSEDHEPRYPGSVVSGKEDANSLHRNDEVVAPLTLAEEKSLPQSDQPNLTTISAPLQRDEDHSLSAQLAGDEDNVPSEVSVNTGYDEMQVKAHAADSQSFQAASVDKDDLSSSGSFAPSQKSLSRLPPNTSKPLAQRFIDEHMLSFSSSEGLSEDSEDGINRRALGPDIANPSVNLNPYDRYRRQINHQAQRRSTSASSIAQYSLPPSDSHSSIDDSLDRLHPDHGEDSFVNELVPMFPKNTISQSLDDDDQALEQYDVQLVAPNMSRMLTAEQRSSLGRSRQPAARPKSPATPDKLRQSPTPEARHAEQHGAEQSRVERKIPRSSSGRSSAGSSEHDMNKRSDNLLPVRQRPGVRQALQTPIRATGGARSRFHRCSNADSLEDDDVDRRSDISDSNSGVSSLGFSVQLHLAAGTTRSYGGGEVQHAGLSRGNTPQGPLSESDAFSDVENDRRSNTSGRSFASGSSMSMDAHINYLTNMRSGIEKSVPLHFRFPAMIHGKKDMTKPPAQMSWSSSFVSSVADERRKDPSAVMGNVYHFEGRRSWHSSTNESLEEHNSPSPRSAGSQAQERESERDARDDELDLTDQSVDGHRNIENTGEANREEPTGTQCTAFDSIKEHVALLPPPPLGLLDMSQPPAPLQKLDRNLGHSSSSSEISEWDHARLYHKRRLYEAEEERKRDDSSSESGVSSSDGSFDSSRSLNTKRAERMDISLKDASDDADGRSSDGGKNISLAEAFQRRHPRFHDRIESHRDKLKRQREKQQEQQREQEEVEPNAGTKSSAKPGDKVQRHKSDPKSSLSQPKQALLDRLATGSRAKISSREMKERSRRLYHQLPEVVERKRQEEMLRRRRQRLDELREQEKERRLQQKQRRQQQLQHKA